MTAPKRSAPRKRVDPKPTSVAVTTARTLSSYNWGTHRTSGPLAKGERVSTDGGITWVDTMLSQLAADGVPLGATVRITMTAKIPPKARKKGRGK